MLPDDAGKLMIRARRDMFDDGKLITLTIARRPIALGCTSFGNALLNREISARIVSRFHDFDIYSHFVPTYAAALHNIAN